MMTVLKWQYQLPFNVLLCLLFVWSIQQICISSVSDKRMKYRYLTAVYALFVWVLDCVVFLHFQYYHSQLIVLLLRLCIAINICIGSWASFNFVIKSVDAIYHARSPYGDYRYNNNPQSFSPSKSPKWFHEVWYFIVVTDILALILTYSLAIFLENGTLFAFFDIILDIVMILGCLVTFVALCNVNRHLSTVVSSSRQNVKLLEKKNGLYYDSKLSPKTLKTIRKSVKKELRQREDSMDKNSHIPNHKMQKHVNGYLPPQQQQREHQTAKDAVYHSLEGASILSMTDSQDIDVRELSKRITIEQQNKRKYKILKHNKRKMDLILFVMFTFFVIVTYSFVVQIHTLNWGKFKQSLYVSPYPTLEQYIAHYVIDSMITFVLILWIYKTSHWCTRIQRDSIIALVCCVCIIEDAIHSPSQSDTSTIPPTANTIAYDKATLHGHAKRNIFSNTPTKEKGIKSQYGIDDDITKLSTIQSGNIPYAKSLERISSDYNYMNHKLVEETSISSHALTKSTVKKVTDTDDK